MTEAAFEDPKVCGPATDYFASNLIPCISRAAGSASTAQAVSGEARAACFRHFANCHGGRAGDICSRMVSGFNNKVRDLNVALADGAKLITSAALGAYLSQRKEQICRFGYSGAIDNAIDTFIDVDCRKR